MGFSGRYHVASLAAVFLALAIGILIGSEFGDDVVSDTRRNLESSLTSNFEDEQDRGDALAEDLRLSEEFAERVYPILVDGRLGGRRIGLVALGALPDGVAADVESALEPAGADLVATGVIREPPDLEALAGALAGTSFEGLTSDPEAVEAFGEALGRQLAVGGSLLDQVGEQFLSGVSGEFGDLDGVVVVREQPGDLDADMRAQVTRLETGLLKGLTGSGVAVVGAEATGVDRSSVPLFQSAGMPSVDDLNLAAGRVAVVLSLRGARGSFGVKDTADRLIPELLIPAPARPRGVGDARGLRG